MIRWLKHKLLAAFPGQPWTWVGHALVALLVPVAIAIAAPFANQLLTLAGASTVVLGLYLIKEAGDKRRHAAVWKKHVHMGDSGVIARTDRWGDLIGPGTATVAFWLAWVLS